MLPVPLRFSERSAEATRVKGMFSVTVSAAPMRIATRRFVRV